MTIHEEVMELLPWFVNGTLNEVEQARVNAHLKSCDTCGAEVGHLMRAAAVFSSGGLPAAEATERARDRFMERLPIAREPGKRWPRRWVMPMTLAASIAVAVVWLAPLMQRDGSFQTLSTQTRDAGPVVQLVFAPAATEADIRQLILESRGRIVSGPTSRGVYRVQLDPGVDVAQTVARLRSDFTVQFAEVESGP